jgi:predicted RNase H-like HicB family nuclease
VAVEGVDSLVVLEIEVQEEVDGRWIGSIPSIPGCLVYGKDKASAVRSVMGLALRVMGERVEYGEVDVPLGSGLRFEAA